MNIELRILNEKFYQAGVETIMQHEDCSYEEAMNLRSGTVDSNLIPHYATAGSAGMDLRITSDVCLFPNCTQLVSTGIALHIGSGGMDAVGLLFPRSSLGSKLGVVLGNGTGVIDADYQGEVKICLWNRSEVFVELEAGERVAQLVFVPIFKPSFNIVERFSINTDRGEGGFGSTGK